QRYAYIDVRSRSRAPGNLHGPLQRVYPFPHAEQTESPAGSRRETAAVVADTQLDVIAFRQSLALEFNDDLAGSRMLAHVRQALLHDPVKVNIQSVAADFVQATSRFQPAKSIGVSLVPPIHQFPESGDQAELIQYHWPQAAQHSPKHRVDVTGDLGDSACGRIRRSRCNAVRVTH